ncbi:hypothetical protein BHM03_00043420 [Ensete ventricosum]|nr:hypothetical protein BHM03_00043420 [Ensete ventricosum]
MYCLNRHVHTKRRQTNERERLFELEIRRTKGFEVKKMLEDGNCLFRAVADQVYGDPEAYDLARQMCLDYMVFSPVALIMVCCWVSDPHKYIVALIQRNIDKDQVKAAIRAQQDQQIDNVSTVAYVLADNYFCITLLFQQTYDQFLVGFLRVYDLKISYKATVEL